MASLVSTQKSLVIRNAIASGCSTKSEVYLNLPYKFACLFVFICFFSGDAAVVGCLFVCLFVCLYVGFRNKLAEGGSSSL